MDPSGIVRHDVSRAVALLAVAACFGVFPGCSADSGIRSPGRPCTANWVPGISIRVVDAETDEPAACGTSSIVTAAGYSAALDDYCEAYPRSPWLQGAWERRGVYRVSLQKPGYQTWTSEEIVVTGDECHVHTIELEARLERTAAARAR